MEESEILTMAPDGDEQYEMNKFRGRERLAVKINKFKADKSLYPLKEKEFKAIQDDKD